MACKSVGTNQVDSLEERANGQSCVFAIRYFGTARHVNIKLWPLQPDQYSNFCPTNSSLSFHSFSAASGSSACPSTVLSTAAAAMQAPFLSARLRCQQEGQSQRWTLATSGLTLDLRVVGSHDIGGDALRRRLPRDGRVGFSVLEEPACWVSCVRRCRLRKAWPSYLA